MATVIRTPLVFEHCTVLRSAMIDSQSFSGLLMLTFFEVVEIWASDDLDRPTIS